MKKVVLVSGSLKLSGSTTWILNLHQGFRQMGVDVIHIVTNAPHRQDLPQDCRFFYTGAIDKKPLSRLLRAIRLHKWAAAWYAKIEDRMFNHAVLQILQGIGWNQNIDLVIKDFTAYLPSLLSRYPVVAAIHQQLSVNWHNEKLRAKALQRADFFVAVSEAARQDALSLGVPVGKVIYNPIDGAEVKRQALEYAVRDIDNFIVFVGSLDRNKGVYELLEAFSLLPDSTRLCFVGSGRELAGLQARVAKLGMSGRVVFAGYLANPYPYIRAARLLVLPSKTEAMPYVPIEASILETPVLVTDFRGASEFFEEAAIIAMEPASSFIGRLATQMQAVMAEGQPNALHGHVLAQMNPAKAAGNFLALLE